MTTRCTVAPVLSSATRQRYSLAFDTDQAQLYHAIRPGYQPEILSFLTAAQPTIAVDLGAGTGHFTTHLIAAGWDTLAVDPAANMLEVLQEQLPAATTVVSSVEALDTTTWQHQADLVVCAQAWHWIDTVQGCATVEELLSDDGVFGIVHHQIDTTVPWVLRLCKIMHSGDVHPVDQAPKVTEVFTTPTGQWWHWEQELTVDQVHQLMMSRAFYLRTNDKQRRRMHNNLDWYLLDELGFAQSSTIRIPYVTAAWRMYRSH